MLIRSVNTDVLLLRFLFCPVSHHAVCAECASTTLGAVFSFWTHKVVTVCHCAADWKELPGRAVRIDAGHKG